MENLHAPEFKMFITTPASTYTMGSLERSSISTNTTPSPTTSVISLPTFAIEPTVDDIPAMEVKNICCVGAGYVGKSLFLVNF
jgi:hypothetical protein